MAFESDLSRAHGRESVDHSESVTSAGRDGEHFQGRVGHEASVGISELTLAVNQHVLGILTSVDGKTTWVPLRGILVQPITKQHYVGSQVIIVEMTVGVLGRWLTYDDTAI